jgi:hypothetical protein
MTTVDISIFDKTGGKNTGASCSTRRIRALKVFLNTEPPSGVFGFSSLEIGGLLPLT